MELMKKRIPFCRHLLPEGVHDDPARAVGGIAGALDRRLPEVPRCGRRRRAGRSCPPEVRLKGTPMCSSSIRWCGSIPGHDLDGVLVPEVIAALDRVEHVPFPAVLLLVAERGADARPAPPPNASGWRTPCSARRPGLAWPSSMAARRPARPGADNDDVIIVFHGGVLWLEAARAAAGVDETPVTKVTGG